MIDHYNLNRTTTAAGEVRGYLSALKGFLDNFNLADVQRVKAGTPTSPPWMGYIDEQNVCDVTALGTKCLNWASLAEPGEEYGLYYHRGVLSGGDFQHYTVTFPGSYTLSLSLSLNNLGASGTYEYEWIDPSTNALKCGTTLCKSEFVWSGSGIVPLVSPTYSFDIALRVWRKKP
jgi:hypothetical protein